MQVSIRTIAVAASIALLLPVAAVAKDVKVSGQTALAGKGFFGGELTMGDGEGQRPVRIVGRGGYVGFLDLGGDLKVRCTGKGRVQKKETEKGNVYLCAGRGGQAIALGSHFKLRGAARQYRALLPEGVEGTFHGRFVECTKGDDGKSCGRAERPAQERPTADRPAQDRPAQERPKRERPRQEERGSEKPAPPADEEEIPTLAELAAMLAGK